MGFKQIRTSDLSGEVIPDQQVLTVVVEGKVFDCTKAELEPLKTVENLVELTVRDYKGDPTSLYATKAEFAKFMPPEKFETLDNSRGRRSGFKPNGD